MESKKMKCKKCGNSLETRIPVYSGMRKANKVECKFCGVSSKYYHSFDEAVQNFDYWVDKGEVLNKVRKIVLKNKDLILSSLACGGILLVLIFCIVFGIRYYLKTSELNEYRINNCSCNAAERKVVSSAIGSNGKATFVGIPQPGFLIELKDGRKLPKEGSYCVDWDCPEDVVEHL